MTRFHRRSTGRRLAGATAVLAAASLAVAGSADAVATGTISAADAVISPGGSTTITADFVSAGDQNVLISIIAAPRAGSTGTMVVSAPSTQLVPPDAGSFNCDVNLSDDSVLDCFWNASGGSGKIADADAEVEFTVTVSGDADGSFSITSFDDTFSDGPGDGDELATTDVRVAAPTTTTSTTTTTTTTTIAATTTTAAATTTTVAATTTTAAATSTTVAGILPETGDSQGWLALAASAAIVAGAGALLVSRRRTAPTS